ncbi:MAG: alcohol dehydrogenase catalytic domain-containing protein [Thermoanaerobaculia bacterium]
MKAVEVGADGEVSVVERPVPKIGPGEALLRTRVSGICGSDLLSWYVRKKAGTVLGHELAGEIVEVGPGVAGFSPGDRVVPHHHAPCLACAACRSGRFVHCPEWQASRLDPGGMAELVRIPAGNLARDTLAIPAGLCDEEASWTEPLATVVKAFRRGQFAAGQSLLVVGCGATGQLAVRLGRCLGASRIAAADRVASRLALASASGAALTIHVDRTALPPGFDFVFVGPGKSEAIRAGFEAVAPGGTLLLFTMAPPQERWEVVPHDLYFREVTVVPSYSCGPDDMREALELLASGRVKVADLVTHRFPVEEAQKAFETARQPEGSLKVVITFSP